MRFLKNLLKPEILNAINNSPLANQKSVTRSDILKTFGNYRSVNDVGIVNCPNCGKKFDRLKPNYRLCPPCHAENEHLYVKEAQAKILKSQFKGSRYLELTTCDRCYKSFPIPSSKKHLNKNHYCAICKDIVGKETRIAYSRKIKLAIYEKHGFACAMCGNNRQQMLEIHHKDKDHSNNKTDNLVLLCANCHTAQHRIA